MAMNAAGTLRFFRDLPPSYRPIVIEQLRTMGGTRFFVNTQIIPVSALRHNALVDSVNQSVRDDLVSYLPHSVIPDVAFGLGARLKQLD